MMKIYKRVSIVIGFVLAVILLAVLGIQLYLNTPQAKEKIEARVNHAIPGTLTWRSIRFSILRGELELKHVLLTGPLNHKVIELDRFSIRISWMGLLKGQLNVHDLVLENPHVYLVRDRSGNFNLIQALYTPRHEPSAAGKIDGFPLNILIRRLSVTNGSILYNTPEETAGNRIDRLVFQNINLMVSDGNLLKRSGRILFGMTKGNVRIKGVRSDIDHLSVKANVRNDRVSELFFDMSTDGIYARLTGTVENLFAENPILDLRLKSRASFSKLAHLAALGSGFSGEIQADSNLKGTIRNPDVDLQLGYEGGKIAGRRIQGIRLNGRLKNKHLNIIDANANTPWGRFDIKGDVDFDKAFSDDVLTSGFVADAVSYKFLIRQKVSQLENMAPGISGLKGAVRAIIDLEGKGIDPRSLRAETTLEVYGDKLADAKRLAPIDVHVTAKAGMAGGRITIRNLAAEANGARYDMNGSYDVFSRKLSAHFGLNAPDLSGILSKLGIKDIQGKMNINGKMSGTWSEPFVDARLRGDRLKFKNVRFGSVEGNFQFSKGRLSLNRGKITSGNSIVDLSGDLQILDPMNMRFLRHPDFTAELAGNSLSLNDFVQGMAGKFDLNGRFKGDMTHPKGKLEVYGKNVDLGIQKIHDVHLASHIDGDRAEIDPLTLAVVPGEKIVLRGWVSLNKQYELHMASNEISIKNIQKLAFLKTNEGKISFNLAGKSDFSHPKFKGQAILAGLMFTNKKLQKISFNIGVENQTAYIDGGPNFDLKATYELQTRSFSTSVRFDQTNLTPYLQLFGSKELNGAVTGIIDVKGKLRAPLRIDGSIKIARLALFWKNTALVTGKGLGIFVNRDEITIPKMRLSLLEKGHLTISGTGKLWRNIDVNGHGVIPFSILPMVTDSISEAGGTVRISLHVRDNGSQPAVEFDAAIENGNVMIPGLFQKFHDVNGHVRATSKAVVFDNIKGMLGAGRFALSGRGDLDRYRLSNFGLKLTADNLPITIPDLLDVRLNSELDVRGSPEKSLIKGDVTILEGRYIKDVSLNPIESIGEASRAGPLESSMTPWPIFDNMSIDCRIRYKDPFVVDNNIALLTIKPDLSIHGTVNHPLISGRAEVDSGTIYFRRNEFHVKKGVLDFINPYKIEPTVDIQGDVKIREWTVFLNVSGTLDNLKFNLSSDPSESEQDILSLLITGKTTQELIAGQGGSSLSPKQMLADVLAENAQKDIKNATGLDVVALEYNGAKNAGESDEVKVTVGKELSKRVTVKYGVQTKSAKVIQKVITEYKLLETLLLNAFEDNDGNYGAEIQFRLEFR
ncbi:MAG: translocation/assembly module TamB domain-containing protein [Desulfobacterales bacterium]